MSRVPQRWWGERGLPEGRPGAPHQLGPAAGGGGKGRRAERQEQAFLPRVGSQKPACPGLFQPQPGKAAAERVGCGAPSPRNPQPLPLSRAVGGPDAWAPQPRPGSPTPQRPQGPYRGHSSGPPGLVLLPAGRCSSLAQEEALPSGRKREKGTEAKLSAFLAEPLLLKAPGWCRPASVGTQPSSPWRLTHRCAREAASYTGEAGGGGGRWPTPLCLTRRSMLRGGRGLGRPPAGS